MMITMMIVVYRYLYLTREDYEAMKARGAVACEEIVDEPSGETRFKILVRVTKKRDCGSLFSRKTKYDPTPTKRALP